MQTRPKKHVQLMPSDERQAKESNLIAKPDGPDLMLPCEIGRNQPATIFRAASNNACLLRHSRDLFSPSFPFRPDFQAAQGWFSARAKDTCVEP